MASEKLTGLRVNSLKTCVDRVVTAVARSNNFRARTIPRMIRILILMLINRIATVT
jgi:hypothetical protein